MFRLTVESKYLWLLQALSAGGEIGLTETTSGRWLEFVEDVGPYREGVLREVRATNIWDRNLSNDEAGLLARQYAFELTHSKRYVEDCQAALLKHLSQNRSMYTDAQVFTAKLHLPSRALQRTRLGGVAYDRGMIYPGQAISWEGGGQNLTSLVFKADGKSIKLSVFNLAKALLDVNLRVWDLENGSYSVVEGTDVAGNDNID